MRRLIPKRAKFTRRESYPGPLELCSPHPTTPPGALLACDSPHPHPHPHSHPAPGLHSSLPDSTQRPVSSAISIASLSPWPDGADTPRSGARFLTSAGMVPHELVPSFTRDIAVDSESALDPIAKGF
ncbi:hypothetical protein PMIN01_04237 [Paraphaeosphaeria minitans]|uniref:Uncharacterized protein n=1 Tax=Paraphaeosphaeria minitans TaxID=565426 RepID=A0A9P6GJB5_9PLEO|nr:hypothetical protein PMIN01_04237 [Paraphaeosphaeria minitans]